MPRSTISTTRPPFVADPESLTRTNGRQIAWDRVSAVDGNGKKTIAAGRAVSRRSDGRIVPRSFSTTLTGVVVASNVATVTLAAHGFAVGDVLVITGASLAYVNGTKTVATVPDANTFTFAATGANGTATGTIAAGYTATEILLTSATQDDPTAATSGYGTIVGGALYETLLPDAIGTPRMLPADLKAELQAAGVGFFFEPYSDNR